MEQHYLFYKITNIFDLDVPNKEDQRPQLYELRTEQRPTAIRLDPNRINPELCGFFSDSSGLGSSRVTLNVSRLPTWIHRALTPDIVCSKLSVLSTGNINERPIRLPIVSQLETVCPSVRVRRSYRFRLTRRQL